MRLEFRQAAPEDLPRWLTFLGAVLLIALGVIALDAAGVPHEYREFGSYLSQWRRRNALKMWTGWPTFPMVFVRGVLVGGCDDVRALIASGELAKLLAT